MKPALDDGDVQIYHGDVIDCLQEIGDGIVQTCVTSPPYWGLRDYGTATWDGGNPSCDHRRSSRLSNTRNENRPKLGDSYATNKSQLLAYDKRDVCDRCGAVKRDSQIGLEATPDEYVARMVNVFREVRRVLRDDGTLWLNLGDSYAGSGKGVSATPEVREKDRARYKETYVPTRAESPLAGVTPDGLKAKDLVGIPWRVAFALQADGWYLRSDIIWHKPNPMPESVTDRPTKAHEYVFLLAKSPRYYYDASAIAEPSLGLGSTDKQFGGFKYGNSDDPKHQTKSGNAYTDKGTRNARSVWKIPTRPYAEAHFAVFPTELPERCIKAASTGGGIVLDPFMGSGTTAYVARHLGRHAIGIELNADYIAIARKRLQQLSLMGDAA